MDAGRATLADVAEAAGVSVATVSKVLNGRSDVSLATRQRVLSASASLGYAKPTYSPGRPSHTGHRLIDLVLPGFDGSWANEVIGGVHDAGAAEGFDIVLSSSRRDAPGSWVDRLRTRGSRGAVLALHRPEDEDLAGLRAAAIPIVMLDPATPVPTGVPSVSASNHRAGYEVARFLVDRGHRTAAVIEGEPDSLISMSRLAGFEAGAAASDRLSVIRAVGDWRARTAERAVRALLSADERPTAVFALSDRMAIGAYRAALSLGLRIPDDVSIVGFDDVPEADWLTPRLTTVHQPTRDMSRTAARMLLRMLSGNVLDDAAIQMPATLVVRESVAAPPLH